jgi:hypothetical protein
MLTVRETVSCLVLLASGVAGAQPAPEPERGALPNYEPTLIRFGGFLQTQLRSREDSDVDTEDTNGFRLARARITGHGQTTAGNVALAFYIESELQPDFVLADAFATASRHLPKRGRIAVDVGQMRVPISRQNLLHDTHLSFVDKALLAGLAPDRDLGVRVTLDAPRPERESRRDFPLPGLRLIGGVYNGEGPNQGDNADQDYLYAARGELTLLGKQIGLAESGFGGWYLTFGASLGRNTRPGDTTRYTGFDVTAALGGVSLAYEYLKADHDLIGTDFSAAGWVAQVCYLLPVKLPPHKGARLELGFRTEKLDPNDAMPVTVAGDPNQAVRAITGVLSYYLRMHSLKAQLAVTSFGEQDDPAFANDQLLIQVTYRME